jgi:sulfite exporter TauE/SafE
MTPAEFSVVLLLGLISGLHCLQMCGPIVLSYSLSLAHGGAFRREVLLAHTSYNAGRIVTYMFLGALAGAAGGGIGLLGRMAGLASSARIVSGACMIVAGALMIGLVPTSGLTQIQRRGFTARLSRAAGRLLTAPRVRGKFTLGLMLGFLPCGLVYAALLKAVESGSPAGGALTMLAFGLGTALALFGMGMASSLAGLRLGRWSTRLAAVSVIAFGATLLWRGLAATPVCHG